MKKIAIIGAGISGLSLAQLLKNKAEVTVFEAAAKPGGLVKCDRIDNNLFHRVGGHVFNSKNTEVLDWFWSFFDRDTEFIKAKRNAKIFINGKIIGYPIENYLFEFDKDTITKVISDLLERAGTAKSPNEYPNFKEFLIGNFGKALYDLYFNPYNTKIWNTDLEQVPLEWLEGKLPMPRLSEILISNIVKEEETEMVHSSFYYAKQDGSQFIANRLAEGLNIIFNTPVQSIEKTVEGLCINGTDTFDQVVYTGDVRTLAKTFKSADLSVYADDLAALKSNGTSNIFCECDATDISWLYLPEVKFKAHRIIYTGNFSPTNNLGSKRITCVVEFSGKVGLEEMKEQIKMLPGNLSALDFNHEPNSYVVQDQNTKALISNVKNVLKENNLHLLGRFAEWEYYNMDKAIEASMALYPELLK